MTVKYVNVKKRSFKMYNYGKKLIIGIIEDISALNTVRMTGNLDDVAMVNKPVNVCVGNNSVAENIGPF